MGQLLQQLVAVHTVPPAGWLAVSGEEMDERTDKRKVSDVNDAKSKGSSKTPSKNNGISKSGGKRRTAVKEAGAEEEEEDDFDDTRTYTQAEGQDAMDASAVQDALEDDAIRNSAVAQELRSLQYLEMMSRGIRNKDRERRELMRAFSMSTYGQTGWNPYYGSSFNTPLFLREQGLIMMNRKQRTKKVAQMTKEAEDACLKAGFRIRSDQTQVCF